MSLAWRSAIFGASVFVSCEGQQLFQLLLLCRASKHHYPWDQNRTGSIGQHQLLIQEQDILRLNQQLLSITILSQRSNFRGLKADEPASLPPGCCFVNVHNDEAKERGSCVVFATSATGVSIEGDDKKLMNAWPCRGGGTAVRS